MGLMDKKMADVSVFTTEFAASTEKLEKMYLRDIAMRKKYFQEHSRIKQDDKSKYKVDLTKIDEIFDEILAEE